MVGIKDLLEGWRSNNGGERVSFGFVLFRAECLSEEDDRCGLGLKGINTPWVQQSVKGGTAALAKIGKLI